MDEPHDSAGSDQATAARKMSRLGKTNWGMIGLAIALIEGAPVILELLHVPLPKRIEDNVSVVFFDCGFGISLISLLFSVLGILQGGRNRWYGVAGAVAVVA